MTENEQTDQGSYCGRMSLMEAKEQAEAALAHGSPVIATIRALRKAYEAGFEAGASSKDVDRNQYVQRERYERMEAAFQDMSNRRDAVAGNYVSECERADELEEKEERLRLALLALLGGLKSDDHE